MKIAKNCVVSIDYTLTDNQGAVLDSSKGQGPLDYIHGIGAIIPGLEKELEGRAGGEQLNVKIAPEDAYGLRDDTLIQILPKKEFDHPDKIKVGTRFKVDTGDGVMIVHVTGIENEEVTLDANHPLAGMELNFDVTVLNVREASPEEIEHGHPHGPGTPHGH
ncbi:MAG: peptidylprolyl isomerase [Pseudomonadota bacterium]